MFTGLIEQVGEVESVRQTDAGCELRIRAPYRDLTAGESIAVNGACLTVRDFGDGWFEAAAVTTTLERTTIGGWKKGTMVNLERAMRLGDRLGGHIVQGHVDCVGKLIAINGGDYRWSFPREFADLVVSKGSIAVDGVSLTIVDPDAESFGAALIPETLRRTNLGTTRVGDDVNLEFDMIAKHVRALVAPYIRK